MTDTFIFTDTETTGFSKSGPLVQEGQGRVCQLAIIKTDASGKTLSQFSSLIKPDGWAISKGAFEVHGITDSDCEAHGVSQGLAIDTFIEMTRGCTVIVAHNEQFDRKMLEIEVAYGKRVQHDTVWFCTMKENNHIFGKWPKLADAYNHYTGKTLGSDAHDALVDATACRDIFFEMKRRNGW